MTICDLFYSILFLNSIIFVYFPKKCLNEILNISGSERQHCYVIDKRDVNGLLVSTFIPNKKDNITKVMDSSVTIWEAENSLSRLKMFIVYTLDNTILIGSMIIEDVKDTKTLYYDKSGGSWSEVSSFEFEILKRIIERERWYDINEDPNPYCFKLEKHHLYGLPCKVVVSSDTIELTCVKSHGNTIWKKKNNFQKCYAVMVHGYENDPKFVHLHIKTGRFMKELFYIKCNTGWHPTISDYFYFLLARMDQEEEENKGSVNNIEKT